MAYLIITGVTLDEENKLVREAQKNRASFDQLYALYLPKVYGFVMGKIKNREAAEDLTGEIFLKILEGLPNYQFRGLPFGAWVFQIARNHLSNYYSISHRKACESLENPERFKDESEESNPATLARRKSTKQSLLNHFHVLTSQESEVVRLKYFAELSNQEIAATLGIHPNHVGVLLFRALKKLKTDYV
ncbi:MAG: sigma-70 family RNA polymerase sigma factor [Candidatus Gracilibacteria bacterium]